MAPPNPGVWSRLAAWFVGPSTVDDARALLQRRVAFFLPADLETLILSCLQKNPVARPQSARELGRRLEECQDAGAWGHDQAMAWWDEHGAALAAEETATPSAFADTMAVDLASDRR